MYILQNFIFIYRREFCYDIFINSYKDDFKNYPAAVQRAIEYLKSNDFTKMETGVYEIEGKLMYAQVFDAETEPLEQESRNTTRSILMYSSL